MTKEKKIKLEARREELRSLIAKEKDRGKSELLRDELAGINKELIKWAGIKLK